MAIDARHATAGARTAAVKDWGQARPEMDRAARRLLAVGETSLVQTADLASKPSPRGYVVLEFVPRNATHTRGGTAILTRNEHAR